jgi:hypothetical protein
LAGSLNEGARALKVRGDILIGGELDEGHS